MPAWASSAPRKKLPPPTTTATCVPPWTTSPVPARSGNLGTSDVLLLGAAGNSGAVIGAELAARGLSVRLAGRRTAPLDQLAEALTARGASAQAWAVDVDEPGSLSAALA